MEMGWFWTGQVYGSKASSIQSTEIYQSIMEPEGKNYLKGDFVREENDVGLKPLLRTARTLLHKVVVVRL